MQNLRASTLKNFYLGTPLDSPEYVRIKLTDIPTEFIDEYNLHAFAHNGWIYFKITKAIYGLNLITTFLPSAWAPTVTS